MLTKNQIITFIICIVIVIVVLIFVLKESFTYSGKEIKNEIREDFPQTSPMNVLYSDANGNLSSTDDLGLKNLTITGDGALQLGSKFRLYASHDGHHNDDWLRLMNPSNNSYGGGFAGSKIYGAENVYGGSITSGGTLNTPNINRLGTVDSDWLRINDGASVGRTALYGGMCINDTRGAAGGLVVGDWTPNAGTGNIRATGNVSAGDTISVSSDRNEGGRISIRNPKKNAAGKTNDWSIWNMTSDKNGSGYGDKLSFWRYNGDGANVGPALDIYDNGSVSIAGGLTANSRDILAELNALRSELDAVKSLRGSKTFTSDSGETYTSYYIKLPGNFIFQYGLSPQPPHDGGYRAYFAIPFNIIPYFWNARSSAYTPTNVTDIQKTYIHGDSNIGPANKYKTYWWVLGTYD